MVANEGNQADEGISVRSICCWVDIQSGGAGAGGGGGVDHKGIELIQFSDIQSVRQFSQSGPDSWSQFRFGSGDVVMKTGMK